MVILCTISQHVIVPPFASRNKTNFIFAPLPENCPYGRIFWVDKIE